MIRKQNLNKNWSPLGSILKDSLSENLEKDEREWWNYQWNLTVGKELSRISSIDNIVKGVLHVRVKSSEWLPVLESLKEKIICELNDPTGKQCVRSIKIIA